MKPINERFMKLQNQNWAWLKVLEKKLYLNILKAQDFITAWQNYVRSAEFWDLTWLWTSLLMKICSLRIRFAVGQGAKKKLMSWVSSRVPKFYVENGFPSSFRDGIVLCALTEKLVPGACPRFDLLDSEQPHRNLKLALYLVEKYIKIRPDLTADDILEGGKYAERKLLLLLAKMKLASEKFNLSVPARRSSKEYMSKTIFVSEKCYARGMGLLLAVRGRPACFTILLDSTDNLDMVIEIRGPRNTACNKRITSLFSLSRSDSSDIRELNDTEMRENILKKIIPLTYQILGRKICVNYTPLERGIHNMSIIWQGQHILGSPYTITVDSSIEIPDIWLPSPQRGYSRLKRSDSEYFDESTEFSTQNTLPSTSSSVVKRKRVLRYIVKIDGNDVIIDGKENLCQAINNLKQRQSRVEENDNVFNNNKVNLSKNDAIEEHNIISKSKDILRTDGVDLSKNTEHDIDQKCKSVAQKKANIKLKDAAECNGTQKKNRNIMCLEKYDKISHLESDVSSMEEEKHDYIQQKKNKNNNIVDKCNRIKKNGESIAEVMDTNRKEIVNSLCNRIDDEMDTNRKEMVNSLCNRIDNDGDDNKINMEQNSRTESNGNNVDDSNIETIDVNANSKNNLLGNSNSCTIPDKPCQIIELVPENYAINSTCENTPSKISIENTIGDLKVETLSCANDEIKSSPKPKGFMESVSKIDNDFAFETVIDDNSFYPVHKVDYELLHADDDDNEEMIEYNPCRRRSFTELNESLYLDEDNIDIEIKENETNTKFVVNCEKDDDYDKVILKNQCETENHSLEKDIRPNFSLFHCDHDLAFWTETVDESTYDDFPYESSDLQNCSEENASKLWEDKLKELNENFVPPDENLNFDIQDCKTGENINLESIKSDICMNDSYQWTNSDSHVSEFSQPSILNKCEEDTLDIEPKTNTPDISEHRKRRHSWSDREHLPSIRESSVEGFLETETYEDRIKSKDLSNELSFSKRAAEVKQIAACCAQPSSKKALINLEEETATVNVPDGNINSLSIESKNPIKNFNMAESSTEMCKIIKEKPVVSTDETKSIPFSMNILSASPYKNKNNSTVSKLPEEKLLCFNNSPKLHSTQDVLVDSKRVQDDYILTYATPVVIDDNTQHEMKSETKDCPKVTDLDEAPECGSYETNEQKPVQCLSVKKVMQIFQQEKEEPFDMWPTEVQSTLPRKIKTKSNVVEKFITKCDSNATENDVSSASEKNLSTRIPRSSIRDRVKLFESDEKKEVLIQRSNTIEKPTNSAVSSKKTYWENFSS